VSTAKPKVVALPSLPPACSCGVDPVGVKLTRTVDGRNEVKHTGQCPICKRVLYSTEWYPVRA